MGEIRDIRTGEVLDQRELKNRKRKYHSRLAKHKASRFSLFLATLAFFGVFSLIVFLTYKSHVYTNYEVLKSYSLQESENAGIRRLGDTILGVSRDGANVASGTGEAVWNTTYAIQDLMVKVSGSTAAIAGFNDRNIYVVNSEKILNSITTAMPIRKIAVSDSGSVTAVVTDGESYYLNTFSESGKLSFSGKTHIDSMGYPMALALSPDGQNLSVSYITTDGDKLTTRIVLYNFGAIGSNKTDFIVNEYTYSDIVVPELVYLSKELSAAVGDSRIMFYKGELTPTLYSEYLFEREVQSVFSGEGFIGLVFFSDDVDYRYMCDVYNASAEKVGTYYFDLDYEDIFFEKNDFVIYNHDSCQIFAYDGLVKFQSDFKVGANLLIPTDRSFRYALVSDREIQIIQLN